MQGFPILYYGKYFTFRREFGGTTKSFRPTFSKGIDTCAKHVCWRRRDGSSSDTRSGGGEAARSRARSPCRTPQRAKAPFGVSFCSFFFAPELSKKKRVRVFAASSARGKTYGGIVGRGLAPAEARAELPRSIASIV